MREPRFDILFEPVRIGPVTARNRFFQVPHCNGMGHRDPTAHAVMRGVKAEGGWAVVCTEEVEIHHSTDVGPYIEGRIWDDADIPAHARLVDAVHEHGSLAGIELVHSGLMAANLYVRQPPFAPAHLPVPGTHPVQARRMSIDDLADFRRWHRQAVARSLRAGYDLVYVYAGHGLTTIQHFLSRRYNDRRDGYGGSLDNRARLLREILEDTLEEVDGGAAVACRICVDELVGGVGLEREEIEEVLGLVGELPDLWDFMVGEWDFDSITSRFADEGAQEQYVRGLKQLTSKPVVGVGRFTSPDTMVRMILDGVLDFVGSARPSIADPFLPRKIEEGRLDEIRECIGCNICVTADSTMTPVRCTQNPSMGEEWRRGWHPERMRPKTTDAKVLVVGAGPAGLEAAQALGKRGYEVVLAEADDALGGRVVREARLPGLASWIRVLDYRKGQLDRLPSVEVALGSQLDAAEIVSYDFDDVALATGSHWRADGVGRWHTRPLELDGLELLTPDDLMSGSRPSGTRVVLFDDDHYYMGGVLAELLATEGHEVTLVTPEARVSEWTVNTMEQHRIQRRLLELGVTALTSRTVLAASDGAVRTACVYTEREQELPCDSLVLVTARLPDDALRDELEAALEGRSGPTIRLIGDAWSPGTIAAAVWDGHRYAEELDEPPSDRDEPPFLREVVELAPLTWSTA
ncbi:MAG TPA: FAD-dependent oxidoreductase [Gaiellaceae bacterium]|nr:FAD-dependent oxidoreductase [Gaiellaceae bacterium]